MEYSAAKQETKLDNDTEITEEMEQAGFDAWADWAEDYVPATEMIRAIYRAMVAAKKLFP
jgi:hypothetical protein